MIVKIVSGMILPFLLVLFFTRVTYSVTVGTLLTAVLLALSIYKGYADYPVIIAVDITSVIIGVIYARKMMHRLRSKA
jgi:general stress protein CsbA